MELSENQKISSLGILKNFSLKNICNSECSNVKIRL